MEKSITAKTNLISGDKKKSTKKKANQTQDKIFLSCKVFVMNQAAMSNSYYCSAPICNPCPELKFLFPWFEIPVPMLPLFVISLAPICNPLIASFCNWELFFTFSFFPTLVLELEHEWLLVLWSDFNETWFETPLIWYLK